MKKLILGLVLIAMVFGVAQQADAAKRLQVGPALRWAKYYTGSGGGLTSDSTRVTIEWCGLAAADAVTACDTTVAFDLSQYAIPETPSTADSSALVSFLVKSYVLGTETAAATTDSSFVAFQFSADGTAWVTLNAATGCWTKIGHSSNTVVKAFAPLNRTVAMDNGCRFIRVLVANVGAGNASTGKLARNYEVYPVYWKAVNP